MYSLIEYGISINLIVTGFYLKIFNRLKSSSAYFCDGISKKSLSIDLYGNIGLCGYLNKKLKYHKYKNSLYNILKSEEINEISQYYKNLNINYCENCYLEGICSGGCSVTNQLNDEKLINFRCDFYRKMIKLMIKTYLEKISELKIL